MGIRRPALLLAGCLAVALLASGGVTGAFWTEGRPVGGVVTAGSLALRVGDAGSQSASWSFTALSGTNLGPGAVRQAPLTIVNAGSAPLRYRLASSSASPSPAAEWMLSAVLVPDESSCPAGGATPGGVVLVPSGPIGAAPPAWRSLGTGGSEVWCLRLLLVGSAAGQGATAGTATTVHLDFSAEST